MKIYVLTFCLISLTHLGCSQSNQSRIDKQDLKAFVQMFASDSLEGRGTGTEGQGKAATVIAKRFEELGLQTHNQTGYLQKFKLLQTYWGQVYIKVRDQKLENFANMVFQGGHPQNEEKEFEIVFGGLGTEAELSQIEIRNRFVLVFVKNLRSSYDVNARARKRGAAGIIIANPDGSNQFESIKKTFRDHSLGKRLSWPDDGTLQNAPAAWDTIRPINTIAIPDSEIKSIAGLSTKELMKLIDSKKINDAPVTRGMMKFERIENLVEGANVIGTIKGRSDRAIVISAHYDHLGRFGKEYFPGADDNASGTAALLELAEEYSEVENLKHSIIFLATSAEEAGLLGSYHYVNQPDFNPKSILCNLNLDMIARNDSKHPDNNYLYCIGTDQFSDLDSLIREADELYDKCWFDFSLNNSKDPAGIYTRSDNYNFYQVGIPAIQFFSGLHSDYHKPTDTADKIDFKNLEYRVQQIGMVIELLQKEEMTN